MKVLIIGGNGMAGHMLTNYLKENTSSEIISLAREDFDIVKDDWQEKINFFNSPEKIDFIVNCIGILRAANENPILGVRVNSLFPHELAQFASTKGIKVIHLSTDCWKDIDVYGRSKRAGEIDYSDHLTIRTSIIGPELKDGTGLFHWFMSQEGEVGGFTKHYWDGITTLELAKNITKIINENSALSNIIDLRTRNKLSKFELLNLIKEIFNKDIKISPKETEIVDKSNPNAEIFVETSLEEQIKQMKNWMDNHPENYQKYF